MDPHSDVRSDVDYQAVLSHMNIHKGRTKNKRTWNFIDFYGIFLDYLDKILHSNEASSNQSHTTVRASGGVIDENDQDKVSIGCNSFSFSMTIVILSFSLSFSIEFSYGSENCAKKLSSFFLFQ